MNKYFTFNQSKYFNQLRTASTVIPISARSYGEYMEAKYQEIQSVLDYVQDPDNHEYDNTDIVYYTKDDNGDSIGIKVTALKARYQDDSVDVEAIPNDNTFVDGFNTNHSLADIIKAAGQDLIDTKSLSIIYDTIANAASTAVVSANEIMTKISMYVSSSVISLGVREKINSISGKTPSEALAVINSSTSSPTVTDVNYTVHFREYVGGTADAVWCIVTGIFDDFVDALKKIKFDLKKFEFDFSALWQAIGNFGNKIIDFAYGDLRQDIVEQNGTICGIDLPIAVINWSSDADFLNWLNACDVFLSQSGDEYVSKIPSDWYSSPNTADQLHVTTIPPVKLNTDDLLSWRTAGGFLSAIQFDGDLITCWLDGNILYRYVRFEGDVQIQMFVLPYSYNYRNIYTATDSGSNMSKQESNYDVGWRPIPGPNISAFPTNQRDPALIEWAYYSYEANRQLLRAPMFVMENGEPQHYPDYDDVRYLTLSGTKGDGIPTSVDKLANALLSNEYNGASIDLESPFYVYSNGPVQNNFSDLFLKNLWWSCRQLACSKEGSPDPIARQWSYTNNASSDAFYFFSGVPTNGYLDDKHYEPIMKWFPYEHGWSDSFTCHAQTLQERADELKAAAIKTIVAVAIAAASIKFLKFVRNSKKAVMKAQADLDAAKRAYDPKTGDVSQIWKLNKKLKLKQTISDLVTKPFAAIPIDFGSKTESAEGVIAQLIDRRTILD